MSFKDSMLRGLAMYGADSMVRGGYANAEVISDIVRDASEKIAR